MVRKDFVIEGTDEFSLFVPGADYKTFWQEH